MAWTRPGSTQVITMNPRSISKCLLVLLLSQDSVVTASELFDSEGSLQEKVYDALAKRDILNVQSLLKKSALDTTVVDLSNLISKTEFDTCILPLSEVNLTQWNLMHSLVKHCNSTPVDTCSREIANKHDWNVSDLDENLAFLDSLMIYKVKGPRMGNYFKGFVKSLLLPAIPNEGETAETVEESELAGIRRSADMDRLERIEKVLEHFFRIKLLGAEPYLKVMAGDLSKLLNEVPLHRIYSLFKKDVELSEGSEISGELEGEAERRGMEEFRQSLIDSHKGPLRVSSLSPSFPLHMLSMILLRRSYHDESVAPPLCDVELSQFKEILNTEGRYSVNEEFLEALACFHSSIQEKVAKLISQLGLIGNNRSAIGLRSPKYQISTVMSFLANDPVFNILAPSDLIKERMDVIDACHNSAITVSYEGIREEIIQKALTEDPKWARYNVCIGFDSIRSISSRKFDSTEYYCILRGNYPKKKKEILMDELLPALKAILDGYPNSEIPEAVVDGLLGIPFVLDHWNSQSSATRALDLNKFMPSEFYKELFRLLKGFGNVPNLLLRLILCSYRSKTARLLKLIIEDSDLITGAELETIKALLIEHQDKFDYNLSFYIGLSNIVDSRPIE